MKYIIGISVYLLSALFIWRYMGKAHSKGGRWENLDVSRVEVFLTFCPIYNTVFCLIGYLLFPAQKRESNFNSLFKVKK